MSGKRADFPCPSCDSSRVFHVEDTDGTYRCQSCGERTHDKIGKNVDVLQDLADSDLPVSQVAETLLGGDSA